MRILFILLLALTTLQVNAQKIIGSTTTAGGDLQGTYPNPTVKSNIINRANLTQTLRDSLLRFRKDTFITVTNSTLNLTASANTLGRYNRVYVQANSHSAASVTVVLPVAADTLKNTEFVVNHLGADTTSALCTVYFLFDNFAIGYSAGGYVSNPSLYLKDKRTLFTKPFYTGTQWLWTRSVVNGSNLAVFGSLSGMTSLTGDVTGSGTGAVATTIAADAVTSAKILNSTIVSADIASQTIDSLDIKNGVITNVKLATDAVTSIKVTDNSLTGSDLTYLTLRAGTSSNASLQLTSGTDKSTLTGGEMLYNGSRFAVGIGSTKRRVPVTNDVSPSNGQLPIGNGTDFTVAGITGLGITVTNGSGSITIAAKRDTLIQFTDLDYNLATALTSTEISNRHNRIMLVSYLSASAASDNQINLPTPVAALINTEVRVFSYDRSADADFTSITFGTNLGLVGDGTYISTYALTAGQTVTLRVILDPFDSAYKWIIW